MQWDSNIFYCVGKKRVLLMCDVQKKWFVLFWIECSFVFSREKTDIFGLIVYDQKKIGFQLLSWIT
jgi:hypothetical protein